ncbi:phage portal protein [Paracoccus methylarcula]|uniref:Phage portal protein n=1 Tax=Paracoccus methylarcula TaxID=72022 RepID=A0A3R7LH05_9RHOB|nr:phage portal protein [Paracoccus methylarcula]RNF33713.1 phage portal protein [Paracoccus methylarcula]
MGWLRNLLGTTKRSYEAATPSMSRFDAGRKRFSSYGPETVAAGPSIRSRARHAAENNSLTAAAIGAWCDSVIGPGIRPTSQHPDPETRATLDAYFQRWARHADASARGDYYAIQSQVARAERIDGESLLLWRGDKLLHLPPEQLADIATDQIVAGVELGDDGQAVAYHIHPQRPDAMNAAYHPPIRVPADQVIHVMEPRGPGQVRGVSSLAPVLLTLASLDGLEDSLLMQNRMAALLSVIVTDELQQDGKDPLADGEGLAPGEIIKLPGNLKITTISPQQSQQSGEFLKHMTRRVAAGVGVPDWLISADVGQANYSSLRAALVAYRQRIERFQFQILAPQMLDPVWRRVATMAALEHNIPIDDDLFSVEHIPPAQPWVDPMKDANASIQMLKHGLASRRQIVSALGYSVEELDAEIQADREREAALGLTFGAPKKESEA